MFWLGVQFRYVHFTCLCFSTQRSEQNHSILHIISFATTDITTCNLQIHPNFHSTGQTWLFKSLFCVFIYLGGDTVPSIAEYDEVATLPHVTSQTPDYEIANITSATNSQPYENIPDTRGKPEDDYEKLNHNYQQSDEHNYTQLNNLRM